MGFRVWVLLEMRASASRNAHILRFYASLFMPPFETFQSQLAEFILTGYEYRRRALCDNLDSETTFDGGATCEADKTREKYVFFNFVLVCLVAR